jgi:MYXO-CTERM domain-containing protein
MRAFKTIRGWFTAGSLLALPLLARTAHAEQLVMFDITYEHTGANDSHHNVSGAELKQPSNWTAPIDYTQGEIHFYQEVMTKPSNKETIIDFCLISAKDYGCIETFIYTTTGVHETMRSMAGKDVDKRALIDFTKPMKSIQMVLKTPAPTYINGGKPQSDFLPSKMRFVATLVPPGSTYVRPTPTPGFAVDGGGGPGADADVKPAMDAAAPASGGSSGSATGGGSGSASGGSSGSFGGSGGSSGGASGNSSGGSSGSASGGSSGKGSGGSSAGDTKPPSMPEPSSDSDEGKPPGCSMVAGAGGGGAVALLAGLGLILRGRRRRSQ